MRRKVLFLFACFFICAACLAQQFPFVFYTPKNGLVNSRVRKMYQDSKGRLYFITYGGLSIYDGARFRNYTRLNGLASDMINDVVEAGEDSFFVAPNATTMNVLVNGQIKNFQPDDNYSPIINHFLKSNDGNIYVTADEGLFMLDKKKFRKLSFELPRSPEIPPFLGNIIEHGDMFLIGTNDLRQFTGLYLYDRKKRKLVDSMPDLHISTFDKDRSGQVWVSLPDKTYMLDSGALRKGKLQLMTLPARYQQVSSLATNAFAFDDNNTWMIHNGKEIIKAGNDGSLLQIRMPERGQGGSDRIFIDRENIVWICNTGSGAFKLVNTTLQMDETIPGNSTGVINHAIYKNDTVWYIVNYNQLARKTSTKQQVFTLNSPIQIISVQQINGQLMLFDAKNVYSAPIPAGTERKIHLSKLVSFPDGSSFGGLCLADPYGNLIVTESRHITVIQKDYIVFRFPLTSISDLVQGLQFDEENRLWMAGRSTGLMVFSLHPDNPSRYLQPLHDFKKEIGDASPRAMVLDKAGRIWIGTRHDGLFAFAYEKNQSDSYRIKKLLHLQTRQGLTDNFITSLACDSAGHIIAGTQTGLDRLVATAKNEYRIENITKSNGVFGYINTTWVDARNHSHALFNNNSVLQILPLSTSQKSYEPDLFIEEIKVNGIPVNPSVRNMQLSYTQRNLSFNVAAPAFIDEQQVKYSYLLEGSGSKEWSEASGNAGINFVNLPPGEYRLQVKAIFPSTSYSSQQISWPFEIIPPWWQRTWFRIMAALLSIAVIVLIIGFYYTQKLKKQRTILEKRQAIEKERTRIATDMHDDLGAGLSRIKFLSETIGIKKQQQQPIEEDINKIREYSHDMIDKMGEIVWALNEKNDSLSDLISYTRAYAVEYLSQNGIQCIVEAPEQFSSESVSGEFRRNIYLTVKEALHNIVKHARANRVHISIHTDPVFLIRVSDNGTGFDQQNIRPFSNGLTNMKKRMESIGGKMEIENGSGTTVVLHIPLS